MCIVLIYARIFITCFFLVWRPSYLFCLAVIWSLIPCICLMGFQVLLLEILWFDKLKIKHFMILTSIWCPGQFKLYHWCTRNCVRIKSNDGRHSLWTQASCIMMEKLHCPCILNLIFYKLFFNEWCNYLSVYLFSLKDQWIYRFLIWYDICCVNLNVGPTQPVDAIYLYIYSKTCYRIFGNVHDDLIFAFFTITFTSQNNHYTEIISGIVCY